MDKKIHVLTEDVINQIAAGEVIENPTSVLKELIDNAIDAKANTIQIEIVKGGLQSIFIEDDGEGIHENDLPLSIIRHATSKIQTGADLFAIHTMGFRGEALSSIAAIAKMKITSAIEDGLAWQLITEGGKGVSIEKSVRKKGTSIEVRNLFFNTPARKKFQKTPSAILAETIKMIHRYVLCYPKICFSLICDKKLVFKYTAKSLETTIKEIFGKEFSENVRYIEEKIDQVCLYGYLGLAKYYKKTRLHQYFFVNRRPIFSSQLSSFLKNGYGTRIAEDQFPVAILFFDVPTDAVDINVHPQKKYIRFEREDLFERLLFQAVKKCFQVSIPSPKMELSKQMVFSKFSEPLPILEEIPKQEEIHFQSMFSHFFLVEHYCVCNQIPFTLEKGIYMIDLRRAYTCLVYELFTQKEHRFESQSLLVPILIELTDEETIFVEKKRKELQEIGLSIRMLGKKTVAIDAYPTFLKEEDLRYMIFSLFSDYLKEMKGCLEKQVKDKIASYISQKNTFSKEEANCLLTHLQMCKDPFYTPSGKPVLIQCKTKDIQKLFNTKSASICQYSNV